MTHKSNPFNHIDLTVTSFEKSLSFYEKLLPELGFTRRFDSEKWKGFAAEGQFPDVFYIAITEDSNHQPNKNLVGLWGADNQEVDHIAGIVVAAGGKITAGPTIFPISATYYSVYFEDPCGNGYEFVHRMS